MTTRRDHVTSFRLPQNITPAQVFLWEMLLTNKWDHLFPESFPILPRQNRGFCPTFIKIYAGSQLAGDEKLVEFVDESFGSRFVIGMRSKRINSAVSSWHPNSIKGSMRLMLKEDMQRLAKEIIEIPLTKVEEKK